VATSQTAKELLVEPVMRAPASTTIENLMRYDFVAKQGTCSKTKKNGNMECQHEHGGLAWVRRESNCRMQDADGLYQAFL